MADTLQIDQAGLPDGTPGKARTDGLSTGATVTLTNTSGLPSEFRLLDVPPGDTTSLPTLANVSDDVATFDPTASVYGSWLIEMVESPGTAQERRERRVFGVRLPSSGLLIPALNEVGDPTANISTALDSLATRRANNNAIDFSDPDLNARPFAAWWRSLCELYRAVESGGGGGGGAVSSVFGRAGAVVAAQNDYSMSLIERARTNVSAPISVGSSTDGGVLVVTGSGTTIEVLSDVDGLWQPGARFFVAAFTHETTIIGDASPFVMIVGDPVIPQNSAAIVVRLETNTWGVYRLPQSASELTYDDTGNTYFIGDNVQAALDAADVSLGSGAFSAHGATVWAAPVAGSTITSLANAGTHTQDLNPSADGVYCAVFEWSVTRATSGDERNLSREVRFYRNGGTCTLIGDQATVSLSGTGTGMSAAFSIVSGAVRGTLTNTTTQTVSGSVCVYLRKIR